MDRVAVAFSGGTDSAFLLKALRDALGPGNVLAVTVRSEFSTMAEMRDAARLAKSLGVKHIVLTAKLLPDPKIRANTPLRCYYCKKKIFSLIKKEALERGYRIVVDASNIDDRKDYRPGRLALKQLGILSPLEDAGMTKARIRALSKMAGLPTWDKPANACLATRIPYGEKITRRNLKMAERAEDIVRRDIGEGRLRVRVHGDLARIEVPKERIGKVLALGSITIKGLHALGFRHITVDMEGYR